MKERERKTTTKNLALHPVLSRNRTTRIYGPVLLKANQPRKPPVPLTRFEMHISHTGFFLSVPALPVYAESHEDFPPTKKRPL